jgi:hypothetical protein
MLARSDPPGAHTHSPSVAHLLGTEGAFSSSEETSRVWRGPKTLGLRPPISASCSRAARCLLLARAKGLATLTAHAALPYGYPTTARPPVRQCRASRQQPSLGSLQALIAVHIDRDLAPCLSRRRRTPKQNQRASDRILAGASDDDNSILGSSVPPQREIPGATAAFAGLASVSDGAFGSVLRRAAWSKVQTLAASTGAGGSFLTSTPLAFFASV